MLIDSQHKLLKNSVLKMIAQAEDWCIDAGMKFGEQHELAAAASRVETLRDVKALLDSLDERQVQVYGLNAGNC